MENTAPFSPVAVVGTVALLVAYVVAAWSVGAGIAGNARKSRRLVNSSVYGLHGFTALVGLASALMIYAFVTHDFSIKYVAATSDVTMSTWYKVTAFWGGLDGSLLFWVLVLALFSTVAIALNTRRHRDMIGYVVATIMVVQVFFVSLLIFTKNPFATFLTEAPPDGQGLNPLLQNYWMVIHPPSLYVGFVAATIPFAFGIGALASGRLDDMWLGSVRVWMLICFGFLSLGLILGGRWAYEELGWGGYWAWDPVENAGFLPWFTATAFLHSAIIQEQRGGMKVWNIAMVILTFFLTIFGTFMTRSGAVQSVHAFGEDNVLALQFIIFMAVILIVSVGLVVYRAPRLATRTQFESFMSREFAFLVNNWILLICAFFVLFATMFPTITEALDGARIEAGIPFFDRWMTFFGLVLLFLAGAAPLLAWRKTTTEKLITQFALPVGMMLLTMVVCALFIPKTRHLSALFHDRLQLPMSLVCFGVCAFGLTSIGQEFVRGTKVRQRQTGSDPFTALIGLLIAKRRKYGGYIVHLGVVIMFFGFAGKAYDRMIDKTIEKPAMNLLSEQRPAIDRVLYADAYLDLPGAWWKQERSEQLRALERQYEAAAPDDRRAFAQQIEALMREEWGAALLRGKPAPSEASIPQEIVSFERLPANSPSSFEFGGYRFLYEQLILRSDDNKTTVTAQVSVWLDGDKIAELYPAKWDFRKGSEATSEVAIKVRLSEDVYVVLTGYQTDTKLANFRVYINPLISWVWIGFLVLALGTLVCLIPQALVDRVTGRGPGPRVGQIGVIALLAAGMLAASSGTANAQGGEHIPLPKAGGGMGDPGIGWSAQNRPDNNPVAKKAMQEVICICGCPRESIYDCKCARAAELRGLVLQFLNQRDASGKPMFDLETSEGRDRAYDAVLDWYIEAYGGEHVLLTPRSKVAWILPALAVVGGLSLLVGVGIRFTRRGRAVQVATAPTTTVEDDEYADKLDDELAKTD
jgi:cytochrome c-type biogenesis protein CcmF